MTNFTKGLFLNNSIASRQLLLQFAFALFSLTLMLNLYFDSIGWSLSILVSILVVLAYPHWITAISIQAFMLLTKYSFEHFIVSAEELSPLIIESLVNISIFSVIAYFKISFNKAIESMKEIAIKDELTDTYNRHYLKIYGERLIDLSKRSGDQFSIIAFDVDHFKGINDTFGHDVGDACLKTICSVVNNSLRKSDVVIRTGGEEFIIILPETNIKEAAIIAERVRFNVSETTIKTKRVNVVATASFGVTSFKSDEEFSHAVIRADNALYKAKDEGRNKVVVI